MTHPDAKLSVSRQAIVLGISRGSVYYKPRPVSDADLTLMHRIDKRHMEFPFAGSRMLQGLLVQEGFRVGRLHVATLMKRMGIEARYRRSNTAKPAPGHKIYPYLPGKLPITRPNQVWAMDITYIPMARGFIYMAAVLDWFTRRVLGRPTPRRRRSRPLRPCAPASGPGPRRRWPGFQGRWCGTARPP
jgi:putative transposase